MVTWQLHTCGKHENFNPYSAILLKSFFERKVTTDFNFHS